MESICQVCHQPILPQYYFCPNCVAKLTSAPLSTSIPDQLALYIFSIILPMIGFIFITRWQGMKYLKSNDPKTKRIGQIAWGLIILSTLVVICLAYVWAQSTIKSTTDSINADFGGF